MLKSTILVISMILLIGCSHDDNDNDKDSISLEPKYIILMIADGMGMADVTAARIYKNGLTGETLEFEQLEHIGYQRTFSKNSAITDSAAAASAMATGYKVNNGELSLDTVNNLNYETILELAKKNNFNTALIATSSITHATPAAFASHVTSRSCQNEIAQQLISTEVDYLFGGGLQYFNTNIVDDCGSSGDVLAIANENGYKIIYNKNELISLSNEEKVLGLFASNGLTPMLNRSDTITEPTLSEMTEKSLKLLSSTEKSFFIMIEGSQIDWANHANDYNYQVNELIEFNNAYIKVKEWINNDPSRHDNTLLIITSDHETGGFAINGPSSLLLPGDLVTDGWTTSGHTGVDIQIWSNGPKSEQLAKSVDNTELFNTMKKFILE